MAIGASILHRLSLFLLAQVGLATTAISLAWRRRYRRRA
jgi:hypothetical protein